ncbi:GNAT family N-acetyltransferase [Paenibacillus lignilyticus]|uniref:GNAT family N-acetyltransferase n=1 Tax=Paenibacillus lignilyticus TaxID=1172615 RepID=A0ABS5CGT8_9BACL|nr:GNAT family N-acetyltransferase [Paenibacillus lignilyticus]MBP3965100.1 GNAT family N-acetyltransferase [Paenibacillus lignilyticus]
MVIVRPYESESDLESLTALMADLGSPSTPQDMRLRMAHIGGSPNYFTFVAELEGAVVGMVGLRMQFSYVSSDIKTQISSLVTKKEFQGRGVGRALLAHVERWVQEQGGHFIYLNSGIKEERLEAHEFYKKRGYTITGYRFAKKLQR